MIDFANIQGPRGSKEANFAQLVGEVLVRECKAFTIDGAGGDEGIDSYATDEAGGLTIFQKKYFRGRINSSRRSQIRHSFDIARRHHKPLRWILCIPIDPTPAENRWLQSLSIDNGTTVEWWGETYLRSLVSRHADLVAAFFPEQRVLAELKTIREELSNHHAIVCGESFRRYKGNPEEMYLQEVAEIPDLLQDDMSLAVRPASVLVAIDFSELYTYMATVTNLVLARPIIDYCIEDSPVPLVLAPGGALHLSRLTEALAYDKPPWRPLPDLGGELLEALRDAFVRSYENDPEGAAANHTYKRLVHALVPPGTITHRGLQRLTLLFRNGQLRSWNRPTPRRDALLSEIYDRFQMARPGRDLSNFAGSVDMRAVVDALEAEESDVRMVTSTFTFRRIAADILADSTPIRTPRQYGQFLRLLELCRERTQYPESVLELRNAIVGMQGVLPEVDELLRGRRLLSREVIQVLDRFASIYRTHLRPVDRMVESGFQAVKRSALASMSDLYQVLSSEAELTAAFRIWWERLCVAAAELQAYINDNYDADELSALSEAAGEKLSDEIM